MERSRKPNPHSTDKTALGAFGKSLAQPVVPGYELIRLIGTGAYGEVWLGRSEHGTYDAVKLVFEKTFRHQRPFEREFCGVQKFQPISRLHDGLTDVLQVGSDPTAGCFYYVMELADDVARGRKVEAQSYNPRTLAHEIDVRKRLPVSECRRIGLAIASALDFLHSQRLVHRDIKPSNIVFANGVPKLADVGLVTEMADARSYVGTEGFIPPEGPGSIEADIYSLGKVLYEISTGKDRHDYPEFPTVLGDVTEAEALLEFNKIVLKACRTNPRERYPSAREMVDDLLAVDRGEKISTRKTYSQRRRVVFGSAAGVIILLAAGAVWWFKGRTVDGSRQIESTLSDSYPAPDGMVGWWRAESDGRDSAGTNDGILYGVSFAQGKVGKAFDIVPPWHRVFIPDNEDFKLTNGLTIEGWIFVRTGGGIIFLRGDDRWGLDPYWLGVTGAGQVSFGVDESLARYVHIVAPISYNEWEHVAGTFDSASGELKLYVNGVLAIQTNATVQPLRDLEPGKGPAIAIGNTGSFKQNLNFNGMVDEIALYSRALSSVEIEGIYRASSKGKRARSSRLDSGAGPLVEMRWGPSAPVPEGLIGWWRGEGDAKDSAGGHDGILRNGASFAPGMVGEAFRFESNGFVQIPRAPCFDFTNEVTIEFWMKADLENPMNACCQGLVTSDYYVVEVSSTIDPVGVDFCILQEDGALSINTCDVNNGSAVISSGQWHHIGAVCGDARLQLYVDGRAWGKPTPYVAGITPMRTNSFIAIGSEDGRTICPSCVGTRYFAGLIDEVSIYRRALTASEIATIWKAGVAGKTK